MGVGFLSGGSGGVRGGGEGEGDGGVAVFLCFERSALNLSGGAR